MDDLVAMAAELCSFADTARLRRVMDDGAWESISDEWDRYRSVKMPSPEI